MQAPDNSIKKQASNGLRYSVIIVSSFFAYALFAVSAFLLNYILNLDNSKFEDWFFGVIFVGFCTTASAVSLALGLLAVKASKGQVKVNSSILKIVAISDGFIILMALLRVIPG